MNLFYYNTIPPCSKLKGEWIVDCPCWIGRPAACLADELDVNEAPIEKDAVCTAADDLAVDEALWLDCTIDWLFKTDFVVVEAHSCVLVPTWSFWYEEENKFFALFAFVVAEINATNMILLYILNKM